MRLKDFLFKYVIPSGVGLATLDSWRLANQSNPTVIQAQLNQAIENYNKSQDALKKVVVELSEHQNHNTILKAKAQSILEYNEHLMAKSAEVEGIRSKMMESGLSGSDKARLWQEFQYKQAELTRVINVNTQETNNLANSINNSVNTNSNANSNTSQTIVTDSTNNVSNSMNNTGPNDLPPTEVSESSILGSYSEMKEILNNELANLSSEQLGCLTNMIGFIMILGGMTTITLILFGEYIINLFKLEEKYPKLAKYINLRKTFNRYYLIVNIIMIYLITTVFIGINLYMFMV